MRFPALTICAHALLLAVTIGEAQAEIRGAARIDRPRPGTLTWGTELQFWTDGAAKPKTLKRATDYGPGGCVADVDGDGRDDLIVQEHPGPSRLLWLRAPDWTARVVESETDLHDCLPFTLAGRRGVMVPHFHAQLRLYLFPNFEYKELYSIYTPSEQGGMLEHDVDGDGWPDLFFGNYWVRNPGVLDVAWRLFAINTIHFTPTAARAALALWREDVLLWAETTGERISLFTAPQDRKQLWRETPLEPLKLPRAVLAGKEGLFIGHAGGVVLEEPDGAGFKRRVISREGPVLKLLEGRNGIVAVSPLRVWLVYPRR